MVIGPGGYLLHFSFHDNYAMIIMEMCQEAWGDAAGSPGAGSLVLLEAFHENGGESGVVRVDGRGSWGCVQSLRYNKIADMSRREDAVIVQWW